MKKKTNEVVQNTFQQGDLLLRRLDKLPDGDCKVISRGRCVLAHGESGHSHILEAAESDAELVQIGERMLLTLAALAPVQHEEHHARTLTPGVWEVGRVKEYDWLSQMERRVQD